MISIPDKLLLCTISSAGYHTTFAIGTSPKDIKSRKKRENSALDSFEQENKLLCGYRIEKPNTWPKDSWIIRDPYNNAVLISTNNLSKIIRESAILQGGLIEAQCIWMREDADNKLSLITEYSHEYAVALDNTKILAKNITKADAKIGDKVLMANNYIGTYLGQLSLYGGFKLSADKKQYSFTSFKRHDIVKLGPAEYLHSPDVNIIDIIGTTSGNKLTKDEYIDIMHDEINNHSADFYRHSYLIGSTAKEVKFVSMSSPKKVTLEYVEIDIEEAKELFRLSFAFNDDSMLLCEDKNNSKWLINTPFASAAQITNPQPFNTSKCSYSKVESIADPHVIKLSSKKICVFTHIPAAIKGPIKSFDDFIKFFKIVKHVGDDTYV
jgi:hypothetical protein